MSADHMAIFFTLEIFILAVTGIASVILLWRTFEDQGWSGMFSLLPIVNLFILVVIMVRIGWWALRHTLVEVILTTILTVASLIFMPVVVKSCPTLSFIIMLMPPAIIGGYLISRKLGCHSYNLYIPAVTITFSILAMIGIFILLMVFVVKSLGNEGIHEILAQAAPAIKDADADTSRTIFNMGLYFVMLVILAGIPSFFVYGMVGAWIGEKIRLQFSHTPPNENLLKIDNKVPPKLLVDASASINSPLRSRVRNSAQEPATSEKPPEKMTISQKLKT